MSTRRHCHCKKHTKPHCEKPQCDSPTCSSGITSVNVWPDAGYGATGREFNPGSTIDAHALAVGPVVKQTFLPKQLDQKIDSYISVTADEKNIFLTTQNNYSMTNANLRTSGEVIALDRAQLGTPSAITWRKDVEAITAVPADMSRSAPAIWGDYIFVATSKQNPQTYGSIDNPGRLAYSLSSGAPRLGTGKQCSMICMNRINGAVVWKSPIGNKATHYFEDDNHLITTMSPIVFKIRVGPHDTIETVVGIGSSSLQSFNSVSSATNAKTTFAPPDLDYANSTARNFTQEDERIMSQVGKFFIYHATSGVLLKIIEMGPPRFEAGHELNNSLPVEYGGGFLAPGKSTLTVFRTLTNADIALLAAGDNLSFAGDQRLTIVLENLFGIGPKTVPSVLNNVTVTDRTGAVVVLVGGAVITNNLEGVVVRVAFNLVLGATQFLYNSTMHSWTSELVGRRALKYLRDGEVLDGYDAYNANYYGASVWGCAPVLVLDKDGVATSIYIGTGQSHRLPAEDYIRLELTALSFVQIGAIVKAAEDVYVATPNDTNFALWQQAVILYNSESDKQLAAPHSPRFERLYFCSIVSIDLRNCHLGDITDYYHAIGYDQWNSGYTSMSLRASSATGVTPLNDPSLANRWRTLYTDIAEYFGAPVGPDGDFGSGLAMVCENGKRYLVGANKFGNAYVFELECGGRKMKLLSRRRLGFTGVLGGANYGVCLPTDVNGKTRLVLNQANGQIFGAFPLNYQGNVAGSLVPPPRPVPSPLTWFLSDRTPLPRGMSFTVAYDIHADKIDWEVKNNLVAPLVPTYNPISANAHFAFQMNGSGILTAFDLQTGAAVWTYNCVTAGQQRVIIVGKELHIIPGRSDTVGGIGAYLPCQYLYSFIFA